MKKKVLIILLLFIPFVVNAEKCNEKKHEEYLKISSNITHDNDYSLSKDRFTITVYNIFDGMFIKYNKQDYKPDNENKVIISEIKPGTSVILDVYADDNCDPIKSIYVDELYYNKYYKSNDCIGYENKIPVCTYQFYGSIVTQELVNDYKENYGKSIQGDVIPEEKPEEPSFIMKIKNFLQKWGIKIFLVAITIFITSTLFNIKLRNIKHGI